VFQHGDGFTEYPSGGWTGYYSRTRMRAEGTVSVDGEAIPVTGSAWFDHQWGDLTAATETGWDWFALQLDDGREVMLFNLRDEAGDALVGATLVEADCTSREVEPADVAISNTGTWLSPHTGCEYPMGWELTVAGEHFVITPVLEDQELATGREDYWEGAAIVSGDASGRAYVELTKYCVDEERG